MYCSGCFVGEPVCCSGCFVGESVCCSDCSVGESVSLQPFVVQAVSSGSLWVFALVRRTLCACAVEFDCVCGINDGSGRAASRAGEQRRERTSSVESGRAASRAARPHSVLSRKRQTETAQNAGEQARTKTERHVERTTKVQTTKCEQGTEKRRETLRIWRISTTFERREREPTHKFFRKLLEKDGRNRLG